MKRLYPYEIVSDILTRLTKEARPGVSLLDLENWAGRFIDLHGVESINKGYMGHGRVPFPSVVCIGVNHVAAHGIPTNYVLKDGDLVSFDIGIRDKMGKCGDAAITVGVGEISTPDEYLLYRAKKLSLFGASLLHPGRSTKQIAKMIEAKADEMDIRVFKSMCGHRIDTEMHMSPKIYNRHIKSNQYANIKIGEIYCVEPLVTNGYDDIGVLAPDGWTVITRDMAKTAMFECMVEVTPNGPVKLTNHF